MRIDDYTPFREEMRRRHGYCGPYRLGIAIGEAAADLPNPYTNPNSVKSFNEGLEEGERRLLDSDEERNKT